MLRFSIKQEPHMKSKMAQFVSFILARDAVYVARESGEPRPWSNDQILQNYKFCNVFRERDRVTRWISANWREPHADDKYLWFPILIARRCINLPRTLSKLGYPLPWNPDHYLRVLGKLKRKGRTVFNQAAYKLIVSGRGGDLAELQVELILNPLWHARDTYRPHSHDTLQSFYERLAAVPFMGSFYAAQVVADLKYVGRLRRASDWWDFAAPGPGSERGLNRILGRPTGAPWKENSWVKHLHLLRKEIAPALAEAGFPRIHAQDIQNCLCEFDKYERIRLGEGTGRKFVPNPKPLPSVED
jgi:5-hmdU DNA kinase-like protein